MKKSTIWIIAIIMVVSFTALLWLQFSYISEMAKMKKEQFDESVTRALYTAAHNLELNETLTYLEKDVNETERKAQKADSVMTSNSLGGPVQHSHQFSVTGDDGTIYSSFELQTFTLSPRKSLMKSDKNAWAEAQKSMQQIIRNRVIYQKILDMGYGKDRFTADSAEPKAIKFYRDSGYSMVAAEKFPGSRLQDTKKVKRFHNIYCSDQCVHCIAEMKELTYKKDIHTDELIYDEFNIDPHTFSAVWYGLSGYEVADLKKQNYGFNISI